VGPLIGGIYAGDPGALSINATLPQLKDAESRYGSIVVGQLLKQIAAGKPESEGHTLAAYKRFLFGAKKRGAARPAFYSFRSGMKRLIEALASALMESSIQLNTGVTRLEPPETSGGPWRVITTADETLEADAVVLAIPVRLMAGLIPQGPAKQELGAIRCISTATAVFAFDRAKVEHSLDGLGFIVPKGEGEILAATWISSKWPHRAPQGKVLMRAFLGGPEREAQAFLPDEEVARIALAELRRLMGKLDDPLFSRVYRYHEKSPQPEVGHLARVARIHDAARAFPGLYLCAGGLDGIGIADCTRDAEASAQRLLAELGRTSTGSAG
jgi:oxygen-dependent protoporphyrinogen oxidase